MLDFNKFGAIYKCGRCLKAFVLPDNTLLQQGTIQVVDSNSSLLPFACSKAIGNAAIAKRNPGKLQANKVYAISGKGKSPAACGKLRC